MITYTLHIVFATVFLPYLSFYHCTLYPPSLQQTNRTRSCSFWCDLLSVSVESHDSITLFFELQPCSQPLAGSSRHARHSWHRLGSISTGSFRVCLALAFQEITPAVLDVSPFLALCGLPPLVSLTHIFHSGYAWLLPDPSVHSYHSCFESPAYPGPSAACHTTPVDNRWPC